MYIYTIYMYIIYNIYIYVCKNYVYIANLAS